MCVNEDQEVGCWLCSVCFISIVNCLVVPSCTVAIEPDSFPLHRALIRLGISQ
jgi:hypothetical protein